MARVLKNSLLQENGGCLQASRQYAYIPGCAIDQAIARVAKHCSVRATLKAGMETVRTRRQGKSKLQCVGQLFVDLSQAFDMLPRQVMKDALLHCGACRYHVQHGQHQAVIDMRRGVRQGCTLAPTLFAAFTVCFQHLLSVRTSGAWTHSNLTLFADDSHKSWVIGCLHDLQKIPSMIQIVYESMTCSLNWDESELFQIHNQIWHPWQSRQTVGEETYCQKEARTVCRNGKSRKPLTHPCQTTNGLPKFTLALLFHMDSSASRL